MTDKRITEEDVVAELRDGMTIGIGGWGSRRKPMSIVRAIARSDLRDLTVVSYGGPDVGLLCATGKVSKVVYSFCSLDSIALEPHFRKARQAGAVSTLELDEGMFLLGLQAAAWRVPFLPTRVGLGSDVVARQAEIRTVISPYDDGEELVAAPALNLDVALVHMHRGDARGNGQYLNVDPYFDDLFCMAAPRAFMSVERVVPTDELASNGPIQTLKINRLMTHGVVEAPYGAHFTECVPDYERDEAFQREYALHRPRCRRVGRVDREVPRLRRPRRVPEGGRAVTDAPFPAADVCVVAIADCFRGDGEIMANPIGTIPMIGGRLARVVFEPDLVMTDGEALLVANPMPIGVDDAEKVVEAWNPYRTMFDVVWSGRRHVMMGASQIDPYGNQNFAYIGEWGQPKSQLLGMRGAPGNTINHTTSYWIPNHSTRCSCRRSMSCPAWATTAPQSSVSGCGRITRSVASSPTSRCSTSPPPITACASRACIPECPSTRWSKPPASSSRSTATCPRVACPPTRSSR